MFAEHKSNNHGLSTGVEIQLGAHSDDVEDSGTDHAARRLTSVFFNRPHRTIGRSKRLFKSNSPSNPLCGTYDCQRQLQEERRWILPLPIRLNAVRYSERHELAVIRIGAIRVAILHAYMIRVPIPRCK